jgi:flagellar export protein FliJ
MTARRWIETVLKARQAHENLSTQRLAEAERAAQRAASHVAYESHRVDALPGAAQESVTAFHAVAAAHQAAAATLAAASHRLEFARARVSAGHNELSTAARDRRTIEKLAEREQQARNHAAARQAQRDLDEAAINQHVRVDREATG